MTFVPVVAGGGGAAAAAAAAAKRRQEEEDMTKYSADDLEGWEFKIVRSNTSRFKNYEAVQQLCREEARAGWEMVEKFDNSRIRFKRRIEKRSGDQYLDVDPYRTLVGLGEGPLVVVIVGVCLLAVGAIALAVTLLKG